MTLPHGAAEPEVLRDIPYLGSDRTEKLDAYLPPNTFSRPLPAVLLIHGGGWRAGDKADARECSIGKTLASAGYAVFSINYLLNVGEKDPITGELVLNRLAWPQNLYDCKSALRYIRAESRHFGIDPTRIAVAGGSAGGHFAMLMGATPHNKKLNSFGVHIEQSNEASCILNFYGDYDIRGRRVSPFAGATFEQTAAYESDASPITYLDTNTPPIFITHGSVDKTIPVERSRLLAEHCRTLGIDYWYIEIGGAPHTYDLQPAQMDLRPIVFAFLQKHLGKPVPAN